MKTIHIGDFTIDLNETDSFHEAVPSVAPVNLDELSMGYLEVAVRLARAATRVLVHATSDRNFYLLRQVFREMEITKPTRPLNYNEQKDRERRQAAIQERWARTVE